MLRMRRLCFVAVGVTMAATSASGALAVVAPPAAQAADTRGTLAAGARLSPGDRLVSPDSSHVLVMQGDGNAVVYAPGNNAIWESRTRGRGNVLQMQEDGNLVIRAPGNRRVWDSGTHGAAGSVFRMQDDGNLVLHLDNHVMWSSKHGLAFARGEQRCHTDRIRVLAIKLVRDPEKRMPKISDLDIDSWRHDVRKGPRLYRVYVRGSLAEAMVDQAIGLAGTLGGDPRALDRASSFPSWQHRVEGCLNVPESTAHNQGTVDEAWYTFQGSTLVIRRNQGIVTGQFETIGAINEKYASLRYVRGPLGSPVTDEHRTPRRHGAYNHFQNGSIYWSPRTGAQEIHGAIRERWRQLGWENWRGFPIHDERRTPRRAGAFSAFEDNASIYWSPGTGAWEVHGAIRTAWASAGWENGPLGFPAGPEIPYQFGVRQHFEFGRADWHRATNTVYLTQIPRF